MKLTASQLRAIQTITNRIQRYYGQFSDEFMSFKLSPMRGSDSAVMLVASNTGSPWYVSHKLAVLVIGPRGGIDRRNYTLDNMRASLVF
jgi:hypothetical protein